VPDFLLRGIDNGLAERIKSIARERNWSINDVILNLVLAGLGEATGEDFSRPATGDIARLAGTWGPDESAAFRQALEAFEHMPETGTPSSGKASAKG
jgi:hypothetical protein